ncbi:hypothetical protein ASE92_13190 [Pedobacter sp. Leaf41]|uniref:hypothetical protein n=1 Tax=Pedobacter sp. Leaf41 TaxID=1736218 RepID=UPI000702EED0|nr:hypothetical protein [Pedobacter sp. Leaf41]KQN34544.1 hypothetical protein ASE92_13190 [Pedobacter sp. Leaf41]
MSVLNEGKEIIKLNNVHYKQAVGLSGKIMFFNMNGDLQNGWEYDKGVITKRINGSLEGYYYGNKNALSDLKDPALVERKDVGMNKLMIYIPPACAFPQPDYKTACVGVEGYMECSTYFSGYICADGAESGGGGGYVPTPIGGGNEGGGGSPQAPKVVDVDPDARQCLKDIKAALEGLGMKNTATGSGLISSVLNKLNLGTGANFNAIITEETIAPGSIAETTLITNPNSWGTQGYVSKINFNSSYLNKASELATVRTMMHEYLHAYFDWNMYLIRSGQKGSDHEFETAYTLLFDESGAPLPDSYGNVAQHEQIAKTFTSEISSMLKNYAITHNIPTPADPLYFDKMAWGGLQKTSLHKFAPDGAIYTNSAEQGNGSYTITTALKCKN